MKRSEINNIIKDCLSFLSNRHFHLPDWGYWTLEDWRAAASEIGEIRDCGLGWDVTDLGSGDYHNVGLTLFTVRNGILDQTRKQYCENKN